MLVLICHGLGLWHAPSAFPDNGQPVLTVKWIAPRIKESFHTAMFRGAVVRGITCFFSFFLLGVGGGWGVHLRKFGNG